MKVKTNNGEVASFDDGTMVVRNRMLRDPKFGDIYKANQGILHPNAFKWAFEVGLPEEEIITRLNDPKVATMEPPKPEAKAYKSGLEISGTRKGYTDVNSR